MQELLGWEPIIDGPNIIGLVDVPAAARSALNRAASSNCRRAGQNRPPTCSEVHSHLAQVREIARPLGIGFLGLGIRPDWTLAEMPVMPKGRYKIMTDYMPKVGRPAST